MPPIARYLAMLAVALLASWILFVPAPEARRIPGELPMIFEPLEGGTSFLSRGGKHTVIYSGTAPGHVGLYQVNAELPRGLTPDSDYRVSLAVNGVSSNEFLLYIGFLPLP